MHATFSPIEELSASMKLCRQLCDARPCPSLLIYVMRGVVSYIYIYSYT